MNYLLLPDTTNSLPHRSCVFACSFNCQFDDTTFFCEDTFNCSEFVSMRTITKSIIANDPWSFTQKTIHNY
jgi:hypothetical protein